MLPIHVSPAFPFSDCSVKCGLNRRGLRSKVLMTGAWNAKHASSNHKMWALGRIGFMVLFGSRDFPHHLRKGLAGSPPNTSWGSPSQGSSTWRRLGFSTSCLASTALRRFRTPPPTMLTNYGHPSHHAEITQIRCSGRTAWLPGTWSLHRRCPVASPALNQPRRDGREQAFIVSCRTHV